MPPVALPTGIGASRRTKDIGCPDARSKYTENQVKKVTLETVARAAGVHRATVSHSVRNHPSIPQTTRERIAEIARKLGYRPNPLVSIYHANIAWIDDQPSPRDWFEKAVASKLFAGRRSAAG
ncbi:MAG: LacI family DNA-binding transcriptional regulator [Verrucomicrobiae bacterium]|nr:LacI family DNA-binding transcriptional regulator [Verrucomicrobiae bacterium]